MPCDPFRSIRPLLHRRRGEQELMAAVIVRCQMVCITNNMYGVECSHVGWRADTRGAGPVPGLPDGAPGRGLPAALPQGAGARGPAPAPLRGDDDAGGAPWDEPAAAAREDGDRPELDGRGDRRAAGARAGRTPARPPGPPRAPGVLDRAGAGGAGADTRAGGEPAARVLWRTPG